MRSAALIAMIAAIVSLTAGSPSAQSIFGLNFIGEHLHAGSARDAALGYSAVALSDTNSAVTSNRATTAGLSAVTFSLHQVLGISTIDYEEEQARQTRYQLPSIMLAVPITEGLVVSGGYVTRFSGRGDFAFTREVEGAPNARELYGLESTLFSIPVAVAWRPLPFLDMAGEVRFERGSINDDVSIVFDEPDYRSVDSSRERIFTGTSWGISAQVRAGSRFSAGFVIDGPVGYSVDERIEYPLAGDLDSSATWDFDLPVSWTAGVSAGIYGRWRMTASFGMRSAPEPAGFPQLEGSIGDERRLGLGLEREGSEEGGFFSRIPLRAGFYFDRWHLEFPSGKPVDSMFFTAGSSFPLPGGPGSMDWALEFGRTGSTSENGVGENTFRLALSIGVSEPWSRRRTERH